MEKKTPAIGYIYEAMDRAKEDISKAFSDREDTYNEFFTIIDRRWDNKLHKPLHAAGHSLNRSLFDKDQEIDGVYEIVEGFQTFLLKMVLDHEKQEKIMEELDAYRGTEGSFGSPLAKKFRDKHSPAHWWMNYAHLDVRSWRFFEHIHSKRRNMLEQVRLNDLVYIKYNRALKRRYAIHGRIDPIALSDIDDSNEWFTGNPKNIDKSVVIDDEDDGLAGVDVGEEEEGANYNLRSQNATSSVARSKNRSMLADRIQKKKILLCGT
ncbi:hypothetical protein LIER_35437 [Lithospermum erythrorhizon]|uniref:Uncharacterized protein n=1 Tax=Lithospermum erythrorhizon TaxID=34254 RepID=A0AAV3NQQ7_LITER